MITVQRGFKGVGFLVLFTLALSVTYTAGAFDRDEFIKCSTFVKQPKENCL